MSSHASSWAKAQRTGPGTPARKCVLMVLADYTNSEGIAYPSRETIAEEAGEVSLDTVDRCIRDLVALGLVLVERRKLNGKQLNNVYRLNVDLGRQKSTLRDNRLEEASGPHIAARLQEPDPEDQGGLLETVEAVAAGPHIAATTGPQTGPQTAPFPGRKPGRTGAALTKEPSKGTGELARASARDPQDDLFDQWWEAYPQHGHGFSKDRARIAWRALSYEDRDLALNQVKRITGKHLKRGKPQEPWYWLQDRIFATMTEERETAPKLEAAYFGRPDTPQWEAWAAHMGKRPCDHCDESGYVHLGLHPTCWHGGHRGRWFTSEWPPARPTAAWTAGCDMRFPGD